MEGERRIQPHTRRGRTAGQGREIPAKDYPKGEGLYSRTPGPPMVEAENPEHRGQGANLQETQQLRDWDRNKGERVRVSAGRGRRTGGGAGNC